MTEADPAFDTVHPSGHILVRSCRGGYMHSVTLTEAGAQLVVQLRHAFDDIDAALESINRFRSYLKAVMEVRGEIVAAGYTPSAEVPSTDDLDIAIERLVAHELPRRDDTD